MNRLSIEKRAQIIGMLVEGNSLRATSRMADVAYNTVLKLLYETGKDCAEYQAEALRNLPCKRVQVDEIWSFCYAKEKNRRRVQNPVESMGSVWTWTAICADTKIVPCWLVADRGIDSAKIFIADLCSRMANRIQLSSDGLRAYEEAVDEAFGIDVDDAMLVKIYDEGKQDRYVGSERKLIVGNPDIKHISTSYVERQNLTMRMGTRRFTRRTNAFSKKIQNHEYAIALHFMHYNFGRIHKSLRVSPAMEAGVADHVWSLEEIAKLTDEKLVF